MMTFLSTFNLKKRGLHRLVNQMIDIMSMCGKQPKIHKINVANEKKEEKSENIIIQSIDVNENNKNNENNENNIELNTFVPNQNIYKILIGNKLKIISKQIGSTPGVKKTFTVKPDQIYHIHIDIMKGDDMNVIAWIKDLKSNKVTIYEDLNNIEYHNKDTKRVDIGISLRNPKYNDLFYVNKFTFGEHV